MKIENKKLKNKVKALQKKPQPEQRTPEWFRARQCRVTASEAASCLTKSQTVCETYVNEFNLGTSFKYNELEPLNPYEKKEDYIIKKCASFFGEAKFKDTVFTLWGKKYEEIACRLYSKLNSTNVIEFGLISHGRLRWLAASPDGITEDGVMLEIKCPKSRKIDDKCPPLYYWIQTQIQLEVCDLEECDFFECEIAEVTEEEFVNIKLVDFQDKGILLQINNELPEPQFVYPPKELNTTEDYLNWKNSYMKTNPDGYIPYFFYITKYHNFRIKRSREWFNLNKKDIKNTWDIITRLQNNKEDFIKYKESIHLIKSKKFLEQFNNTNCLISDNHSIETPFYVYPITLNENVELVTHNSEDKLKVDETLSENNAVCMID